MRTNGGYSGFKIFHDNGETNSNSPNWRVVTEGGNWISRAFNMEPDEEVTARGLFWADPNYNDLRKQEVTDVGHKGKRIHVNCDGEPRADAQLSGHPEASRGRNPGGASQ